MKASIPKHVFNPNETLEAQLSVNNSKCKVDCKKVKARIVQKLAISEHSGGKGSNCELEFVLAEHVKHGPKAGEPNDWVDNF